MPLLSHQTIIIIAVCASVGTTILLCLLFRAARYIRSSTRSAPLPPVQPLAHHREQHLATLENAYGWNEIRMGSKHLPTSHLFISPKGSRTSLLGKESPGSSVSRRNSLTPGETTSDLLSQSPTDFKEGLLSPSVPFHMSSSNFSLSTQPSDADSSLPSPHTSPTSNNPRSYFDGPSLSGSSKLRPTSTMSTPSSVRTRGSRNTLRGMPHSPHSQVQIMLPAPLGGGLSHYTSDGDSLISRPSSRFDMDVADRRSIVDRWVATGRESTPEIPPLPAHSRGSPTQTASASTYSTPKAPDVQKTPHLPPMLTTIETEMLPETPQDEKRRKLQRHRT